MDLADPLCGQHVEAALRVSKSRIVAVLDTGEKLQLLTCDLSVLQERASVLQGLQTSVLQPFLGVSTFEAQQFLVFADIPGETLAHTICRMRLDPRLCWVQTSLLLYMKMMSSAVAYLHSHEVLHWKINTAHFFMGPNNKVVLGGLNEVGRPQSCVAEKVKAKEIRRLATCFVSMLTLKDYEELALMPRKQQLQLCVAQPICTKVMTEIIKSAMNGTIRYWDEEECTVFESMMSSTVIDNQCYTVSNETEESMLASMQSTLTKESKDTQQV